MKTILLASLMCLASICNAAPLIDFSGISAGASVNDYYNGGTDSAGESGPNYGIHFSGGTVAYNQYGAYLKGGTRMTFDSNLLTPNADGLVEIGFLATLGYTAGDAALSLITYNGDLVGGTYVFSVGNPNCQSLQLTIAQCVAAGYVQDPASFDGYIIGGVGPANQVDFNVNVLDDIDFNALTRPDNRVVGVTPTNVPEPSSLALLAIGAFGFVRRRFR